MARENLSNEINWENPKWEGNRVLSEAEIADTLNNNLAKVEYFENLIKTKGEKTNNQYKEQYFFKNKQYSITFTQEKNGYKSIKIENNENRKTEYEINYNNDGLLGSWTIPSKTSWDEKLDLASPSVYNEHLLNAKKMIESVANDNNRIWVYGTKLGNKKY